MSELSQELENTGQRSKHQGTENGNHQLDSEPDEQNRCCVEDLSQPA